jgi:D-beta-D-heptose 7-phosphate kinase / D-beta-D-heptose 1-phosphate adenosyltransferase
VNPRATGPLVIVGDALLDRDLDGEVRRLCPGEPAAPVVEDPSERVRPGGAALAALLAAQAGHDVVLITPLDDDEPGREILRRLDGRVTVIPLPWPGATAEKQRVRASGSTLLRIDRPARPYAGTPGDDALHAIATAGAILVSDYGNGTAANPVLRQALTERAHQVPLVWDPHSRGAVPVTGTRLATPNQAEAAAIGDAPELLNVRRPMDPIAAGTNGNSAHASSPDAAPTLFGAAIEAAYRVCSKWPVAQLCITLGSRGALLLGDSGPFYVAPPRVSVGDACGAGNFFAATLTAALRDGAVTTEAMTLAVAATAEFLAAGGVAALDDAISPNGDAPGSPASNPLPASIQPTDGYALADTIRAQGGVVAATGGCFDLLHAGHVQCLRAARQAADCLIVCLNSDDSARALKGPGRPLNNAADRAAVLLSLDCVDAVVVFDEPDPTAVLRKLRPDVWIKGGDYDPASLPETPLVRSWGGHVLTVPYLSGRSTTRLVDAARDTART